jgi:hypothetical protein
MLLRILRILLRILRKLSTAVVGGYNVGTIDSMRNDYGIYGRTAIQAASMAESGTASLEGCWNNAIVAETDSTSSQRKLCPKHAFIALGDRVLVVKPGRDMPEVNRKRELRCQGLRNFEYRHVNGRNVAAATMGNSHAVAKFKYSQKAQRPDERSSGAVAPHSHRRNSLKQPTLSNHTCLFIVPIATFRLYALAFQCPAAVLF